MDSFLADLRHSARVLWKNPAFTIVAIAALALGIGANTAIFSVVNTVLLKPLPYPEPDRIVRLARQFKGGHNDSTSIPKFTAWQKSDAFESMALYDMIGPGLNLGGGDRPEQLKGIHVSAGYFRVFGVSTAYGRTFTREEDLPNGPKDGVTDRPAVEGPVRGRPKVDWESGQTERRFLHGHRRAAGELRTRSSYRRIYRAAG